MSQTTHPRDTLTKEHFLATFQKDLTADILFKAEGTLQFVVFRPFNDQSKGSLGFLTYQVALPAVGDKKGGIVAQFPLLVKSLVRKDDGTPFILLDEPADPSEKTDKDGKVFWNKRFVVPYAFKTELLDFLGRSFAKPVA